MDPFDDLFSKDGWVITTNANGKTKGTGLDPRVLRKLEKHMQHSRIQVASCNSEETNPFIVDRSNWITFHEDAQSKEEEKNDKIESQKAFKPPFDVIRNKKNQKRLGFYLIRDLLNFKRPNSLTEVLVAENMPLNKVVVCARITSYAQKNNFHRLTLDDATSSILCIVRIKDDNVHLQESCDQGEMSEETDTSLYRIEEDNSDVSWAIKKLNFQRKKLVDETSRNFDEKCLGRPVRIMGYLREFCGKNYIFAYKFQWVTEKYLVDYLNWIIQEYEYKENYMLE